MSAVPRRRLEAFATVADATKAAAVIVVCRSSTVEHQYRLGVGAAGGDLDNLHFHRLGKPKPTWPPVSHPNERTPL